MMPSTDLGGRVAAVADTLGLADESFVRRAARLAIALTPAESSAGVRSRLGGDPDMAPHEVWPEYAGGPGWFIGQIDFSELPDDPAISGVLPSAGLLRLFVPHAQDESVWYGGPGYVRALFLDDPAPVTSAVRAPAGACTSTTSTSIRLTATVDLPADGYQIDRMPDGLEDDEDYDELRRRLHGDEYLLGWPSHNCLAYDPTPSGMIPFLTLSSVDAYDWCWADGDYLMIFGTPADLAAGRFDDLRSDAG